MPQKVAFGSHSLVDLLFHHGFVLLSLYLITHLGFIKLPHFLSEATTVEFVVFPFFMVLLFLSVLLVRYARRYSEFESPLLQKEDGKSSKDGSQTYSNAGVWSKLTFPWLNPLFAKGRVRKLELPHIPSIPQSETAESASLLLEELLRKQKTGYPVIATSYSLCYMEVSCHKCSFCRNKYYCLLP